MDLQVQIATLIREMRERRGLNFREFGKLIGTSRQYVQQLECGRGGNSPKLLQKIANATGETFTLIITPQK